MPIANGSIFRWFAIRYSPHLNAWEFLSAAVSQKRDDLEVRVAVMDVPASRKFFGVPMARRGIQPVWVHVVNRSNRSYRLQFVALDPNHFSPLEAAALNHYSGGRRLLGYGLLAWLFLPLLILLPIKLLSVRRANRAMDAFFLEQAFRMRPIPPGGEQAGFVYTNLSEGNKIVLVRLLGPDGFQDFEFTLPVEGLRADYLRREFEIVHEGEELTEVDMPGLRRYLAAASAGHHQLTAVPAIRRSRQPGHQSTTPFVLAGPLGPGARTRPKSSAWRPAGRPRGPFSPAPNIATRRSAGCFYWAAAKTLPCSGFAVPSTNACICGCGQRRSNSASSVSGSGRSVATSASASPGGPGT